MNVIIVTDIHRSVKPFQSLVKLYNFEKSFETSIKNLENFETSIKKFHVGREDR